MDEDIGASIAMQLKALAAVKRSKLSEAYREFDALVGRQDELIGRHLPEVFRHLAPATALERSFKYRLVERYKSSSEAAELLTSGEPADVRRALKCRWFFAEVADPAGFVREVVPSLSAAARVKVVNKYAACLHNAPAAEVVYREMKTRYGVKSAIALLSACGENFIRRELPNVHVPLPPSVVLALLDKFPALTVEYLNFLVDDQTPKNRKQESILTSYESVFLKLSNKDLDAFLLLYDKHNQNVPFMKLGRRVTKKLIKTRRVVDNYGRYSRILVDKTFFSRLSLNEIGRLYDSTLMPATMKEFCSGHRRARAPLPFLRPNLRGEVVRSAFASKYGRNMGDEDVLGQLGEEWVEYLRDGERVAWATKKLGGVENVGDRARVIAKLPTSSSVAQLKALLESQSDAATRAAIASQLVHTLRLNRTSELIPDVFAYLVKRFRNEVKSFRKVVIEQMGKLGDLYLDVTDWTAVNEFVDVVKLNGESSSFKYDLRKVFEYQVRTAVEVGPALRKFVEFELADGADLEPGAVALCANTPQQRSCLDWFSSTPFTWKKDKSRVEVALRLFEEINRYNCSHADLIKLADWIVKVIDDEVSSPDLSHYRITRILDSLKKDKTQRHDVIKKCFPRFFDCSALCRLLSSEPELIHQHARQVMEVAFGRRFDDFRPFYLKSRYYEEFGLTEAIVRLCRVAMQWDESEYDLGDGSALTADNSRPHAVRVLALLLPPKAYLEIAEKFAPTVSKIDEYTAEIRSNFEVQQAICRSLVDVRAPLESLMLLRRFAVGDYLKLTTGTLIGLGLRVAESKILPLITDWLDCPVSLRKHLLRLTCFVAPTVDRVAFLVNVFKTEKNVSLRLVMFKQLRKAFDDEPDDDTYNTFTSIIAQLTIKDEEALKTLLDLNAVDGNYVAQYLELLWELSGAELGAALPKSQILDGIDRHVVRVLSEEFCNVLVAYDLATKLPTKAPSKFLYNFLLQAPSEAAQSARLDTVLSVLIPSIEAKWDVRQYVAGYVFSIRAVLAAVVRRLCAHCADRANVVHLSPVQLLTDLKKSLSAALRPEHFLNESIAIDLTVLLNQHNHVASAAYVTALSDLYNSYATQHSSTLSHQLICALAEAAPCSSKLELAHKLILRPIAHPTAVIAAIELLESDLGEGDDEAKYRQIVERLSTTTEPAIQAAAHKFFASLEK